MFLIKTQKSIQIKLFYILRCKVPECEEENESFLNDWLNVTVPFTDGTKFPEKCERFLPIADNRSVDFTCSPEEFERESKINCNEFVYEDDEVTILNQVSNLRESEKPIRLIKSATLVHSSLI